LIGKFIKALKEKKCECVVKNGKKQIIKVKTIRAND